MEIVEESPGEEESIDEEYEEYLRANIIRDEELIRFVEEFMNSEEMYLLPKKKIDNETIVEHDSICSCTECEERAGLVKHSQKIWALERRFEKHLQNKIIKKTVKHQEASIKVIREKIAEAKQRYLCHKQERELLEEKHREAVLEDLKNLYHVDTKFLTTKSKPVDKVLVYSKIRHVQRIKQKERIAGFLRKILNEYKRQEQIDTFKNKRYDTKVVPKEKILEDVEVVGTKIELIPRHKPKVEEVEEEKVEEIPVEVIVVPVAAKLKKGGKDKKDKKGRKDKKGKNAKKDKGKKSKDKSSKKDKKSKKGKDKKSKTDNLEVDLVLPYVPITNVRNKIKVDEEHKMVDLIKQFDAKDDVEIEREKFEIGKMLADGIFYPEDPTFVSWPKILSFQNFRNNVIYKKRIRILNGGTVEKKCRFYVVRLEEFHPALVEVEPIATQIVIPGMFFYITVTFSPETLDKSIKGHIIFLTYNTNQNGYTQISVPVSCTPWASNVGITPDTIIFDTLPIWEAKKRCEYKNYRTLKICNTGKKSCRITITKIKDPFQLDEIKTKVNETKHETSIVKILEQSGEVSFINEKDKQDIIVEHMLDDLFVPIMEESNVVTEQILDECVGYVFNAFLFECYCFNVEGKSEKIINIYFRNINYVGSYNEKYLIGVFEEFEGKDLECIESKVSGNFDMAKMFSVV